MRFYHNQWKIFSLNQKNSHICLVDQRILIEISLSLVDFIISHIQIISSISLCKKQICKFIFVLQIILFSLFGLHSLINDGKDYYNFDSSSKKDNESKKKKKTVIQKMWDISLQIICLIPKVFIYTKNLFFIWNNFQSFNMDFAYHLIYEVD